MKIILKYILNSIKERKLRTMVMLLSVTLSTTLLFVSFGIGASYESAQRKMAIGYAGKARIAVTNTAESNWITKAEIPEAEGIQQAVGLLQADGLYDKDGYYENFDLIGGELADLEAINAPRVQSGDLSDFSGDQIAVPDRFASKYGTKVGDTVRLKIAGDYHELEVAAICAYDTIFLRSTRGFNALIPFETLSKIVGSDQAYSEILIVPESGADTDQLQADLSGNMSTHAYEVSAVYNETAVAANAQQKSMPFYLISFFTLTISSFIIYSSYKIITSERLKAIGTFRSIGADQRTVRNILMAESLVYGVSGSLLGIPAGYLTLKFLLYGMSDTASYGIEIPLVVSPLNVIFSCGVAIIVSVLGAYIPVKRASKLPVKDVVLGTVEEKPVSNQKILLLGLLLFIISIILPRITSGEMVTVAGGVSLITLLVGAIMIVPLLINAMSQVLEKVYGLLFGNVGKLAARNLRGNKNTNQNATLLFISISAIIVISTVGSFVNVYIGDVFRDASLDGFSDAVVNEDFIDEVRNLDTVSEVLPLYVLDETVQVNGESLRMESTDDIKLFNEMLGMNYSGDESATMEREFDQGRNVMLNRDVISAMNLQIGDAVNLSGPDGIFSYTVAGSFQSRADDVAAVIPSSYAKADFSPTEYGFFAFKAGDPEAVMTQLRDMLGEQQHWSRTVEEYTNDASETIDTFLSPMQKLTWFILLLATVGIINNLLINYIQKKRAIAMYKSVGLSNAQNLKMTMIEGFSVGLLGALLAVAVSYVEIKTVFLVAGPKISMEPQLELSTFLFAALMGIVITLIGSVVPIVKGATMKLVEEIKFE
ncbi:FtsX-like permease family protein [Enterococcus sp. 669A]|uniref:FtsX-like permease family protein n=1 Tax=Candidatus Enterococcus moelleringii TaxID=2815325 RepID=A0ABS3LDH7_9ENTE|nr:FtsX-like permease family protein [Enterococcus sp. 669A]